MINLIPNEEKKIMTRDFYFRLLVVFFMIIGSCVLITSVSIIPSYLNSLYKKNLANQKLAAQNATPKPEVDQKTTAELADFDKKLSLVENAEKNKYDPSSKVINEVLSRVTANIKINEINYQNDSVLGKSINVIGIASNRQDLLVFRQSLGADSAFKNVNLPISSYVKDSDISFYVSIVPSL